MIIIDDHYQYNVARCHGHNLLREVGNFFEK